MGRLICLLTLLLGWTVPALAAPFVADDFETASNTVNGRSSVYAQEPSRALQMRTTDQHYGGTSALMLKYDKKGTGGPYDAGGWCGYYTQVKSGRQYFDAAPYTTLTLWVKGATGDENFMMGMADRHWDAAGDSVKSAPIGKYLPAGQVTTDWQQARIPLAAFMVDLKELATVAVCFEKDCFPNGEGKGTVYIDDLAFE
ncbi:MAG: hypothetical protein A3C53_01100 [Omnitrophica WOR_2 bacterium RIFCSPHIGHO2_02_FULL_68_15]|nr:MAG: hypothetical protein A3C53_01100 [Omnitrophica WOR_2 bacterium RIFCSPHIGHO2_02_FULL_68_15]